MSDSKRATLITVGAPKSANKNVNKTVRLTINLDESTESKYPELNYKELVIAEEKKKVVNGKTPGLDPFSDNDEDVERVAKKFEQKYGGQSTYGKKARSKRDDYADIGAGYDENDSFIDNTDGYDEIIPPECDTFYGGFYINSGSLEFKNVDAESPVEGQARRNKRRLPTSSSEDSTESTSESESLDGQRPPPGDIGRHDNEHRKKKNKKSDKKKPKKIRRKESSIGTSGKQTSDDAANGDGSSADSRTSHSDSLTSKPAPSSENPVTSDSSRDLESKADQKLPAEANHVLEEITTLARRHLVEHPNASGKEMENKAETLILRLQSALTSASSGQRKLAWGRAARALRCPRGPLLQRAQAAHKPPAAPNPPNPPNNTVITTAVETTTTAAIPTTTILNNKKAHDNKPQETENYDNLTEDEKKVKLEEVLVKLKQLIDERTPAMMATYNAECERVQEERKKLMLAADGGPVPEKRMPKRRFPWCPRARALLAAGRALCADPARLMQTAVLPLFPQGFVTLPTLLRQADLRKELKTKKSQDDPTAQPTSVIQQPQPMFTEPIQFPSSLTVTMKPEKETPQPAANTNSIFGTILNSFNLNKDLVLEKQEDRKKESDKHKDDFIPANSIGSITITAVPNNVQKSDKKQDKHKEGLIRVKSPAALNEMANHTQKKEKEQKHKREKNHVNHKEKRVEPLHVDTNYHPTKKDPSPKTKDDVPQVSIDAMRINESNIPRPALIPVHSPTFAKPDKRPPEVKKKKDLLIVSDVDPLGEQEPLAIDDSSSDVEVIEDKTDKSDSKRCESETVPCKNRDKSVDSVKSKDRKDVKIVDRKESTDEATEEEINALMQNLREMENSQEPTKVNSNFGGVRTAASKERSSNFNSRGSVFDTRTDKNKLTNFFEQNGWL